MTKRRLLRWSPLLLIAVILALWFEPTGGLRAWLRGEAFYRGRPTSYWREIIRRDLQTEPRVLLAKVYPPSPPPPSWWDRCKEWIGYEPRDDSSVWLVAWSRNGDSTGVLRQLEEDADERIAGVAADVSKLPPWRTPEDYWITVIRKHR